MQVQHQLEQIIDQRYRIVNVFGEGGSSIIYQAEDLVTRQKDEQEQLFCHFAMRYF